MPVTGNTTAGNTPKRVLMIAYHFPPLSGSSGIQRTLRFVQHLPAHGWQPLVLSAHPRAYESVSNDLLAEVPSGTVVERAFALDTARHLSIAGRYLGRMAIPDRWRTWAWGAVPAGMSLIRRFRPDVIWSTFPIATAHLIALRLHRRTGIPWIADFRDPMAQEGYPADPATWQSYKQIEQDAAFESARMVFATGGARDVYANRYPQVPAQRFAVIENGYDEESFVTAEREPAGAALNPGAFTLLHSGIVYPSERDPRALFTALGRLRAAGEPRLDRLRLRFRAPVHGDLLRELAVAARVEDLVEILPPIPYHAALREMLVADGLMVMQGSNCNEQIPAKLYEYMRARRPLLGLADPEGDTGRAMLAAGVRHVAQLENAEHVERMLRRFLDEVPAGSAPAMLTPAVTAMSRSARTESLARLLDAAQGAGRA